MENILYPDCALEHVFRPDGTLFASCYSPSQQTNKEYLPLENIILRHNTSDAANQLLIFPLATTDLVRLPEWLSAQQEINLTNIRFAINYDQLNTHADWLQSVSNRLSFWLYDFAPPGSHWSKVESVPLSGVVFSEAFFRENYTLFTFPFLLERLRQEGKEVLVRAAELPLLPDDWPGLHLTGWQPQTGTEDLLHS